MSTECQKLLMSGQKAYRAGNFGAALDIAKQALKAGGKDVSSVHVLFGAILTAQEEYEMADRALRQALSIDKEVTLCAHGCPALHLAPLPLDPGSEPHRRRAWLLGKDSPRSSRRNSARRRRSCSVALRLEPSIASLATLACAAPACRAAARTQHCLPCLARLRRARRSRCGSNPALPPLPRSPAPRLPPLSCLYSPYP